MQTIKSLFMVFFLVFITVSCSPGVPQQNTIHSQTIVESLQDSSVAFVAHSKKAPGRIFAFCTGVWISPDVVLTASHCVEPDEVADLRDLLPPSLFVEAVKDFKVVGHEMSYYVFSDVGSKWKMYDKDGVDLRQGFVTAYDPVRDLALVKMTKDTLPPAHPIVRLSKDSIHSGDRVHIVGHTVGMWWTYTPGSIAMVRDFEGPLYPDSTVKMLQVSCAAYFGNSGGGVFDTNGHLLGIASFLYGRAPNLVFFVHRDEIFSFLAKNGMKSVL